MNITDIIDKHEPLVWIDAEELKPNGIAFAHSEKEYAYESAIPLYTRATVEKMLGEVNSAVFELLTKARHQLPMAAQCWNEDDDRDRADRNIKRVLELIDDADEFLSQNRLAAPSPAKEQG